MTNSVTPAPLGQPTQIDIRAIERELTELWRQATDGQNGDKPHSATRTRVLSLIVVTRGDAEAEHATEIIARLNLRHPHRAIVVNAMPEASQDQLDAWVQAHCQIPQPGRPRVCGEQITIEARGPAVDRVPNTVLPLLVPDIPVMLWWMRGEPFDDPRFVKFSNLVDRVIVDSATFDNPEASMARMGALLAAGTRISDLAWSRLTPWRELTAQFFDAPAQVPHLNEIAQVTVNYEAQPGADDRSPALLIVGWLAARLGWRAAGPISRRGQITTLPLARANGDPIVVKLRPAKPKEDALDRLAALALEGPRAKFSVARDRAPHCAVARAEVAGMPPLTRKVHLEQPGEAELIGAELQLLGQDQTFGQVLRISGSLLGGEKSS
jgi:glucose-6-phosphate dehydrogenase assembly protein OpcA